VHIVWRALEGQATTLRNTASIIIFVATCGIFAKDLWSVELEDFSRRAHKPVTHTDVVTTRVPVYFSTCPRLTIDF
jgi:hypothetical protein